MHKIIKEDISAIVEQPIERQKLKDKKVIVTGASGMIGGYICKALEQIGAIAITVRGRDAAKYIPKCKCDYIIHAASSSSPKQAREDYDGVVSANIDATRNLLRLAKQESAVFLFISSGSIYGNPINNEIVSENDYGYIDLSDPRTIYAESKRLGESICLAYSKEFGVKTHIARLASVLGPGIDLDGGGVHSDFLRNALNNENIVIKSDGLAKRSFIYLADCVSALFYILLKGNNATSYNISNTANYTTIRNYAKAVAQVAMNVLGKQIDIDYAKTSNTNLLYGSNYQSDRLEKLGWKSSLSLWRERFCLLRNNDLFNRAIVRKIAS